MAGSVALFANEAEISSGIGLHLHSVNAGRMVESSITYPRKRDDLAIVAIRLLSAFSVKSGIRFLLVSLSNLLVSDTDVSQSDFLRAVSEDILERVEVTGRLVEEIPKRLAQSV